MARLNDPPPMSMDTSDILRKKLLRQNRELARQNSILSQQLRAALHDAQQQLNQKLELASRVIELEQQIERNASQRIADHALDVRARLEAQLLDCMSLLDDIGQEPPRKKRQSTSITKSRASIVQRSPPRRRLAETEKEAEDRAVLEGRLPPVYEAKSYPRRTLNRDQIMALCSEAADTTDSPELGPPPMSRYVDNDTDPIKLPSPSKSPSPPPARELSSPVMAKSPAPISTTSPVKPTVKTEQVAAAVEMKHLSTKTLEPKGSTTESKDRPVQRPKVEEAARTSSKRKFSTSDSSDSTPKPVSAEGLESRTNPIIRGDRKNKSLKELASIRREAREKLAPSAEPRKVLAAKSTNEDMNSPRKISKPPADAESQKPSKPNNGTRKEKVRPKPKELQKAPITIAAAVPAPPKPVEEIVLDKAVLSIETMPMSPASPVPTASATQAHDTPPPADISAHGETARPSRRARASVSYAEPNLRDKMRRPTKELFDAVTGEGRHKSRSSIAASEEPPSVNTASVKQASTAAKEGRTGAAAIPTASEAYEKPGACSPLAQKTSNKAEANKQRPALLGEDVNSAAKISKSGDAVPPSQSASTVVDPYDFASSVPGESSKSTLEKPKAPSKRQPKSSRRLSSVARDDALFDEDEASTKTRTTAGRKRASIAHTRPEASLLDEENPDTSGSVDGEAASRTNARRRSMMV